MKLVSDEIYGKLSYAERAAIRKYNVSPFEHRQLVEEFGRGNHEAITRAIEARSTSGMYMPPWR